MSITNARRHDLHTGLEEALGPERAETLMDYLPPVGWADVATKRDLDNVEERLGARIDGLESRIDSFEERVGLRLDNFGVRLDSVKSEVRHEIADLRTSLMRQQLFLAFALIGVLGTLMAVINGFT